MKLTFDDYFPSTTKRIKDCDFKNCIISKYLESNEACRVNRDLYATRNKKENKFCHGSEDSMNYHDKCSIDFEKLHRTLPKLIRGIMNGC